MARNVDEAMVEVVHRIQAITAHLREHDYVSSANKIAKSTNDIIAVFTDTIVAFERDQMAMTCENNPVFESHNSARTRNNDYGSQSAQPQTAAHTPNPAASQKPATQQPISWAKVAESGTPPSHGPVRKTQANPTVAQFARPDESHIVGPPIGLDVEEETKAGSVSISGKFTEGAVNFITSKIREGPLYRVDVRPELEWAEIIFQNASNAHELVANDREMVAKTGHGRFGKGYQITCVAQFEWTEGISAMAQIPRERRRLTFARAGLLGSNLSFRKFQGDVTAAAGGSEAIDLVWAFNSGNVTAIFKSVPVARAVRDYFLKRAEQDGPYKAVQITFSTDPCERPLFLATQLGAPSIVRNQKRPRFRQMMKA